jgi:hypothetical protein
MLSLNRGVLLGAYVAAAALRVYIAHGVGSRIANPLGKTNELKSPGDPSILFTSMTNPVLKFSVIAVIIGMAMSSCVPLAIGAAGAAAGYIARDEGVGVVEPAGSEAHDDPYGPAAY